MYITVSQLKLMLAVCKPDSTKPEHERLYCAINITKHDSEYWFECTNGAVATRFKVTDGIKGTFPEIGNAYVPRNVFDNFMKILPKGPKGKKHNNESLVFNFEGKVLEISNPSANVSYRGEFHENVKFPSFQNLLDVAETETNTNNGFALFSSANMKLFEDFLECNREGNFGAYGVYPYKKQGNLITFIGDNGFNADINHYRAFFIMLSYRYNVMYGYEKSTKAYI